MRFNSLALLAGSSAMAVLCGVSPALASDTPIYQSAPAWVVEAPKIVPETAKQGSPVLIYDLQQKLESDRVWSYSDTAVRADTPTALTQLGTLTANWSPDKGDLIIHRAEIIRGSEVINLLASAKFDVLRREQQLEKRALDGQLTSTMAVPGLRVGDILRLTMSTTQADKALSGHVQSGAPIIAEPVKAAFARLRVLWPEGKAFRWQAGPRIDIPASAEQPAGDYRELNLPVPIARPIEMPGDSPTRFRRTPWFQIGNFTGWEEVSKVMAPLFATDGLIAAGSPLAGEVKAITAATGDPLERTARALELVQGKIAYLLVAMDGGNYVPQPPARTWELRYGDCKAKTLLLLAMLRAMGIEAEPVLARSQGGDALPTLLPMPADFDHVLVHARLAGKDLWLDGTGAGTRKEDLTDTPPFFHVLPLRSEGAGLMAVPPHANARPNVEMKLVLDQRAGLDVPAIFDMALTFRGAVAAQLNTSWIQSSTGERKDLLASVITPYSGDSQLATQSFAYDDRASTATITVRGIANSAWRFDNGVMRMPIALLQGGFSPDRARPAWRDIPVATDLPQTRSWNSRYLLPDGGAGFTVDGSPAISAMLGGAQLVRSGTLAGDAYTLIERIDQTGAEIAPAEVSAEKARVATARAATVSLVAPKTVLRRWQYGNAATRARLKPLEDVLALAIAANPGKPEPLEARAGLYSSVLDWRSAADDLGRAIALEPRASDYLARSQLREYLGDLTGALADAIAAQELEPADSSGLTRRSWVLSLMSRHDEAVALLQERIDTAGDDRLTLIADQAELLANAGKADQALARLDTAIAGKPGDPILLNGRCWIKGTRNLALDTALRDCTKAIELTDSPGAILDSRAMVYFRMGRLDDAMADLNAALQANPELAPTLYMHGIILKRSGHAQQGQAEIDQALRREPSIGARYKGYGIVH